jgi:hypothetical protein
MKSAVFDPRIVALLAAGCAAGTARWDVGAARPVELAGRGAFAEALPDAEFSLERAEAAGVVEPGRPLDVSLARAAGPVEPLPLAAARAAGEQESQGVGIYGRVQYSTFGGTRPLAFRPPAGGPRVRYPDVFDPSVGFGASLILARPPTGKLALGDVFTLFSFEYQLFPWNGEATIVNSIDDLTVMSFWLEAKTMLGPLGATGNWKPYVLLGVGLAITGEVNANITTGTPAAAIQFSPFYEMTWGAGLRARLGIEYRAGNIGFFGELGAQMVGAPTTGLDVPYGDGETIFYTPFSAGIIINF